MNLLTDIKSTARTFRAIRGARKAGADSVMIQVEATWILPSVNLSGCWIQTVEGNLFQDSKWEPVRDVFDTFPEETQQELCFIPKGHGGWAERARFWQEQLGPALPPELYHTAMLRLLHWYAHCVRMRSEEEQT